MAVVLLDTDDLDEAEAALSAAFSKIHIDAPYRGESGSMRIERSHVGSIAADSVDYGWDFSFGMEALEQILLCGVVSGGIEERLPRRRPAQFGPGDVLAAGAIDGLPFTGKVQHGIYHQLVIERSLFSRVATGGPESDEPVRLTGSRPVSPGATRGLSNCVEYVMSATSDGEEDNALVSGSVEEYVAALILASYPNTALFEPTIEDRHDSTPVLLRRAIAFIDDNAQSDISLADIAEAVHVTPRALQYMFRKHRDSTPMEYLRQVRLHYAHLDLLAGQQESAGVADIARRWGFAHTGRFAVFYRDRYGQSPHVTLRG